MINSVNGINGTDYSNMLSGATKTDAEKRLDGLDVKNADDESMLEACKEFEKYMIEQVYKAMEKTVMKADEEENDYEEMFGELRIRQYAEQVSEQGKLGLAQQLYENMKRNQGIDPSTL